MSDSSPPEALAERRRVLLVYGRLDEKGKAHRGAPLSVLAVGSHLIERDYRIDIHDLRVQGIEGITIPPDTLYVGISAMTGFQIRDGLDVARRVREARPDLPIVWGGWHPTILPEETLAHPLVDIVVIGQGERTAYELAEAIRTGGDLAGVRGIAFERDGEVVRTPKQELLTADEVPRMDYSLIDVKDHLVHESAYNVEMITYLGSRGCPHRCGFCAMRTVYDRKWVALPPERVLDELEDLIRTYKVNGVYFEDDNFFVDRNRAKEICRGMIARDFNVKWTALARADYIVKFDEELLGLMRDAGCIRVLVGAESGSQAMLDLITKDIRVEQIVQSARLLDTSGIEADLSFMVGFPEDDEEVDVTLGFILRLKRELKNLSIKLFLYTPFPGSALYTYAVEHGFEPPASLEAWADFTMHRINTPWVRPGLDRRLTLFRFYFSRAYPHNRLARRGLKGIVQKAVGGLARRRLARGNFAFPFEYWALGR